MSNYKARDLIRLTRLSLKISQEKLSENICSVQTLSRIENGKHNIKRETYQRLMERMDRNGEKTYCVLYLGDFDGMHIMEKANIALLKNEYRKLEKYIFQLKPCLENNILNQQYVQKNEVMVSYRLGRISRKEFLEKMEEVIAFTIPNYEKFFDKVYPFTNQEIMILMNLATA